MTRQVGSLVFVSLDCQEGKCDQCTRGQWRKLRPHQGPPIAPLCQHECHEGTPETVVMYSADVEAGLGSLDLSEWALRVGAVSTPTVPPMPSANGEGEGETETTRAEGTPSPRPFGWSCNRCRYRNAPIDVYCWNCGKPRGL